MEAIKHTFFQECDEQLAELEAGLLTIDGGDHGPDVVNAVFRAVHSIKGGAGAFGLDGLVRFAHVFETALDGLRAQRLSPDPAAVRVLLRAADLLADLVREARGDASVEPGRGAAIQAELESLECAPAQSGAECDALLDFQPVRVEASVLPPSQRIRFRPHASLYASGNDPLILLRELGRCGTARTTLDASQLPGLDAMDPEASYLSWTVEVSTDQSERDLREVFEFVDAHCHIEIAPLCPSREAPPAPGAAPAPAVAAPPKQAQRAPIAARPAIRVDLGRLDRLIDLVGELVINQAALAQRVIESGFSRSSAVAVGLEELEQLARELQDGVMAIRAQPMKAVFQRLPRLARDVAAQTGKAVTLVTDGEATEVDTTVIERLSDPLTHMIRNAIDHGIEPPERRLAAGKPAEGTVRVSARHRSGRIVIEVADDGAGIDRPRVLASAIAKRLAPAEAALSDEEIDSLIFTPGFSTATAVSDISGRGVGMDVVRRSIQALGGRISIRSQPGGGSTFSLSLPLTLAVLDGMVVGVGGGRFVVPLTAILETFQPRAERLHQLCDSVQVASVRGSYVPLIDVGVALGLRTDAADPASAVALLIEAENGTRAALLVDVIHGQRQVVIKSLEVNYRHVAGVAAATILGDGIVALILDVAAIVDRPAAARVREAADA